MKTTYTITARTGRKSGAGTDAEISITLVGELGESGPHVLDKPFHDDFKAGAVDVYEVKGEDVGEVVAVRVHNRTTLLKDDWLLEEFSVASGGITRWFPFYRWVGAGQQVQIVEGAARLPQQVHFEKQAALRAANLEDRRQRYRWKSPDPSLPGQMEVSEEYPLPMDEQYRDIGDRSYKATYLKTIGELQLARPILAAAWNALERTRDLLQYVGIPAVSKRWRDDLEFARQTVQGVNPQVIALATALPEGMPLTEPEVRGLLDPGVTPGVTLAAAFAARRMFLLDFPILVDLPMYRVVKDGEVSQRWAPPARALFFRNAEGHLRPVAIQLGRDASAPVFTPHDSEHDWLAAKLFVRCAEGNMHQIVTHAVATHFAMEPFIVAMMRSISAQHPVYKLTRRHARYTLAINQGARETLLAVGGVFDDFIACGGPGRGHIELALRAWAGWRFEHARLPDDLRRRGVEDPTVLPYYPYRDDALPLWDAIGEYVRATLGYFYKGDEEVAADPEIQAFWQELVTHGVPADRMPYAGLTRLEDLCDLVQTVIFNVSVAHSAVNNLQFEHYAWVPNAPLAMHGPPPTQKGVLTARDVHKLLPSLDQTIAQIAIGRALSTLGIDEEYLLPGEGWHRNYFQEAGPLAFQREFFATLRAQAARVDEANRTRPVAYEILRPDRVPCSITI